MAKGKIIDFNSPLSKYNLQDGINVILSHKNPPKEQPKLLEHDHTEMQVEETKKSDEVVPILQQVREEDVDRSALNQLLMLGYEKDLSLLALRSVGTQYGSLGYDGLNKAIDWIQKKLAKDAEKMINPISDDDRVRMAENERKKKQQEEFLEMRKKASSEAKKRYQHLQNSVGQSSVDINISNKDLAN